MLLVVLRLCCTQAVIILGLVSMLELLCKRLNSKCDLLANLGPLDVDWLLGWALVK